MTQEYTDSGIDYAITTVQRPGGYIHKTMASLGPDLPLRLVVGCPDASYLDAYRCHPQVEIMDLPASQWEEMQKYKVHRRASWNYWRTLVLGAKRSPCRGLAIFEDDVKLARGWRARLGATISRLESIAGTNFVLALYIARSGRPEARCVARSFQRYDIDNFWGTQGMYYTDSLRLAFANYLKAEGVDKFRIPYDILLKEFLKRRNIPLFVAVPTLVQHIGMVSTGLGNFHNTEWFADRLQRLSERR
jgi:hypothetical protein